MKTKIFSGATLAAAAIALALSGVAVTPAAAAHHDGYKMEKSHCSMKHHCKTRHHCKTKHHCKAKHSCKK